MAKRKTAPKRKNTKTSRARSAPAAASATPERVEIVAAALLSAPTDA